MRLRFTIRDLLWLTVVVALAVGWLIDRHRLASQLDAVEPRLFFMQERMDHSRALYGVLKQRMRSLAKKQNNQEIEDKINALEKEAAND